MKITLAQALPLRNAIARRINELMDERNKVAFVEAEKGETYDPHNRNIDQVAKELDKARKDYRLLDRTVAYENLHAKIAWDGEDISLTEALELAKQMRMEAASLKSFGSRKKQERKSSRGMFGNDPSPIIIHAQFDPEEYRKKALKLERMVNKLSYDIERKNHFVEFEFPEAVGYID